MSLGDLYMQTTIKRPVFKQLKELKKGQMFVYDNHLFVLLGHSRDEDNNKSGCEIIGYISGGKWLGVTQGVNFRAIPEEVRVQLVQGIF
jgi:hypothetical protein